MQVSKAKKGYKLVDTGFGKFEEIPEEWEIKSLGDLCLKPLSGGRPQGGSSQINEGIPSLGGENISKEGTIVTKKLKLIPESFFEKMNVEIQQNDILLVKDGATTGRVGLVDLSYPYSKSSVNEHLFILRTKKNSSSHWLYNYLFSNLGQNEIKKVFQGSAQGGINLSISKNIQIIVPSLNEQEKIATIFTDINNTLKKTNRLIQKRKLLKKGLMQQLFTKGIRHLKFKEMCWGYNRNIKIPEEWDFNYLESFVFFQEGPGLRNWQFTKNGMKVINVGNIVDGKLDTSTTTRHISQKEFNKKYTHFELEYNDIVISSSGWSYGKVAIVKKTDLPLMLNTSVIRFKPLNNKIIQEFLYHFLNTEFFKRQIDYQITGIDIPNFGSYHLKKMKIMLPPINEQKQIASILSNVDSQINKEKLQKSNLEILKKGLMQKLLTGQIRVRV